MPNYENFYFMTNQPFSLENKKLAKACEDGDVHTIKQLVELHKAGGIELDFKIKSDCVICNLLALNLKNFNPEICEILIENGVSIYDSGKGSLSVIHIAAKPQFLKALKFFIKVDPNVVNFSNRFGQTPLHLACQQLAYSRFPDLSVIELLINSNADINKLNCFYETPLSIACKYDNEKVLKMLLSSKVERKTINDALIASSNLGNKLAIKMLLDAGADVNYHNMRYTPLVKACLSLNFNTEVIFMLLKAGACPYKGWLRMNKLFWDSEHGIVIAKWIKMKRLAFILCIPKARYWDDNILRIIYSYEPISQ